jgi:hypothetical protein
MTVQKIYIRLMDGTECWVPINAKLINNDQFEVIENPEFMHSETIELYEFFPRDIVQTENHAFQNGRSEKVAKRLISKGHWPDRNYLDFKFKATSGLLKNDKETALIYQHEIDRVRNEQSTGQFFYPLLIETVDKLEKLLKLNDD